MSEEAPARAGFAVSQAVVVGREELAAEHVRLDLEAPGLAHARPGQFVHVLCRDPESWDPLLRRPFSVADVRPPGEVTLVWRVVGRGTAWLARRQIGDVLEVMGPLGRGFTEPLAGSPVLLVGGGTGVPPLYFLARRLIERGHQVGAVLGFRSADRVILAREMADLGATVHLVTEDGSAGRPGTAAEAAREWWHKAGQVYACGPWGLLAALHRLNERAARRPLELSVETVMGCGAGVCLSCVVPVRPQDASGSSPLGPTGWARACREGPVFSDDQVDWERCARAGFL